MPKTLLAVDDSATMRKVLEITFAGEDFRVVGAENAASALAKLTDDAAAAVLDASLGSDDSYGLAKEVRARSPRTAVVFMASRYSPYDANRGRDAGIDDYIDKPFDTQALIDKVKKAIVAREQSRTAAPAPPPQALNTTVAFGAPLRPPPAPPAPPAGAPSGAGAQPPKVLPTQRTHTLSFEGGPPPGPRGTVPMAQPMARTAPSGVPALAPGAGSGAQVGKSPQPAAEPVAAAAPLAAPAPPQAASLAATAAATAATNGQLPGKLEQLGLTADQVRAVMALSRELIERVVWEVVPPLAEALIKEEIARLTREG